MPPMKSVFISFSKDASIKAKQIAGYLEPLGVDTFDFEKDMGEKTDPRKGIKNAIKSRDAVILILSANSRESQWVANELGIATGLDKKILIYKTAHNLELPGYLDKYAHVLTKLDDLDEFFS